MPRAATVASMAARGRRIGKDLGLLKALQIEISHEQSPSSDQYQHLGCIGDFKLAWDAPNSEDIFLQKKSQSGEEFAVSALLGPESTNTYFPWDVTMKVCIKKPVMNSVLQFDCNVVTNNSSGSEFSIRRVCCLPSLAPPTLSDYRGPEFSTLDPILQEELKRYLESKGIGESLTNFLLHHLHKKGKRQYVAWLEKIRDMHQEECVKTP